MTPRRARFRKIRSAAMKLPLMLTCRDFETFVLDFFENALPLGQRVKFKAHLALCRDCRSYLAAYRQSVALGKAAFMFPDDAAGDEVPEELVKAILDARALPVRGV